MTPSLTSYVFSRLCMHTAEPARVRHPMRSVSLLALATAAHGSAHARSDTVTPARNRGLHLRHGHARKHPAHAVMVETGHSWADATDCHYPTEYCGLEAAGRIYQAIDASELTGKLVICSSTWRFCSSNALFALTHGHAIDGKMIDSTSGDPNGTTDGLADLVFKRYVMASNYHIDLYRRLARVASHAHDLSSRRRRCEDGRGFARNGHAIRHRLLPAEQQTIFDTKPGTPSTRPCRVAPSIISEAGRALILSPLRRTSKRTCMASSTSSSKDAERPSDAACQRAAVPGRGAHFCPRLPLASSSMGLTAARWSKRVRTSA